ncbi:MAG: PAS domain S-box protein [Pegethrix bostrychoides GSE-TBD4-15B]|jgi:PAS domain S-box-containing protein|uniref:histidine kinase n=1 Tax=Pegethrix bostrychoides GSE-TBD4-15B TaxID=2839662 RepID=A0A951U527_9CYAN|nr:PAS domain S-box protein [Pegethrix bostrychoides GSE-TBD4-15B]
MWIRNRRFSRLLPSWRRSGLGAALLLLLAVGVSSYNSLRELVLNRQKLEHSYQVLRKLDRVESGIKDSELGRRGYLVQQDEDFLLMFRSGLQTADVALDELQTLTGDEPNQQQRIQAVRLLVNQRFSALRQSVGIQRNFPKEQQTQAELTLQGQQAQYQIQVLLSQMSHHEQSLLQQRSTQMTNSLQATKLISLVGYGLSFGLIVWVFYLLEAEIRQRRAAEQTSRQSVTETADLYNNAPCGYHSLDRQGRFVQINDTELNWLGYERSELLGQPVVKLLSASSQGVFQALFPKFVQQGQLKNLELELRRKDGSMLPVSLSSTAIRDAAGRFIMSRSSLFDISELKQTEAALRMSEATFRSLSEFAPIGIFMTNAVGQMVYSNAQAQKIGGYSLAQSLGFGWTQFIHPDDLRWIMEQWREQGAQASSTYNDVRYLHQDGTIRYGCVRTAPILSAEATPVAYVGTVEDITESRAMAQIKSEFVSTVSHELRTPLTAIRGSLGLLAGGVYDQKPEKGRRMLQVAAEQTDRLVRLINDILDFQRLESGKITLTMQSCDAAALIQQAVEAMRPSAEAEQIQICVALTPIQVWVHPDSILQTLTNLISNAIKFSDPGKTICVSVQPHSLELDSAKLRPSCGCHEGGCHEPDTPIPSPPADYALFMVQDEGRGIPAELLEKVFDQFQQVDASDSRLKGGTGLGLAICRKIVEQQGGQIWAESLLGQGSVFCFTVPLQPTDSPAQPPSCSFAEASPVDPLMLSRPAPISIR